MRPSNALAVAALALLVAACAREPLPPAPPAEHGSAPVVRRPAEPAPSVAQPPASASPPPVASAAPSRAPSPVPAPAPLAGIVVPPEAIYVCVVDRGGERTQTVIEFAPRVLTLCRRHPEMGPCQYERNACRASGGRVFAANGQEITMATEAEYDRRVRRVTFRAH